MLQSQTPIGSVGKTPNSVVTVVRFCLEVLSMPNNSLNRSAFGRELTAPSWLALALAGMSVLFGLSSPASGDQPRLILTTGGPISPTRSMVFSQNSSRLFTAGGDKMVRIWDLTGGRGREPRIALGDRLYWPIARGDRGHIAVLDVSPQHRFIAFAGVGGYDPNGDIHVYEIATGELRKVLGTPNAERQHRTVVTGIQFSPDGKRLATVSEDGEVRVWDCTTWQGSLLRKADRFFIEANRQLCFLTSKQLAVPVSSNAVDPNGDRYLICRVGIYDVTRPHDSPRVLAQQHMHWIHAIARDRASSRLQWATADAVGNVYLWNGDSPQLLRSGKVAKCLTFGRENHLFVGTKRSGRETSTLEMWETDRRRKTDEVDIARTADCRCCAADRNGRYVAAFDRDDNAILLWHLTDEDGNFKPRPLSGPGVRKHRVSGSGETPWQVAFADEDPYRLVIADRLSDEIKFGHYGRFTKVFDIAQEQLSVLQDASRIRVRNPDAAAGAWRIERSNDDHRIIELFRDGREQGKIVLDDIRQGKALSYCWLADQRGTTYGLAIGTERHGVFVYSLPKDGRCELLRYFRDHRGWVTSLSLSRDGKYLASSSVDQTIKIWSLEGIQAANRGFTQRTAWGADFQVRQGRLIVANMLRAGIAAGRGLQEGDIVEMLVYPDDGRPAETTDPDKMLDALERNPMWESVRVSYRTPGERAVRRILVTPAWEPVLTFFVDQDNNWATWTNKGYYLASAIGDSKYGWILNADRFEAPEFVKGSRLRKKLERPEIIKQLLTRGNIDDAIRDAGEEPPAGDDGESNVKRVAKGQPKIEYEEPLCAEHFELGQDIPIGVRLVFPDRASVAEYDIICYVNGVPLEAKQRQRLDDVTYRYRWLTPPLAELNRIKVVAQGTYAGNATVHVSQVRTVTASTGTAPVYQLHIVTISGSDYPFGDSGDDGDEYDLGGGKDAERLLEAVDRGAGSFYKMGHRFALSEAKVSAKSIREVLERISKSGLRPSDLLVVYLAGHGFEYKKEYVFLPAVPSDDVKPLSSITDEIEQHGVSWEHIGAFCRIPCRKLFLIDTCRQWLRGGSPYKGAIRPLEESESLIITATHSGGAAAETEDVGGGVFTTSVVECFAGRADGFADDSPRPPLMDGRIDIFELRGYVVKRTKELAELIRHFQKPWTSSTAIGDPVYIVRAGDD